LTASIGSRSSLTGGRMVVNRSSGGTDGRWKEGRRGESDVDP
jgi:hypothetical protein